MRNEKEVQKQQFSQRIEEILRAQPLNPFVRLEFFPSQKSWSMREQDSNQAAEREASRLLGV